MFAITAIKGIGRRLANVACKKAEVDLNKRAGELSASELESLMVVVSNPRQFRVPDWFLNRCVRQPGPGLSQVLGVARRYAATHAPGQDAGWGRAAAPLHAAEALCLRRRS